MYRLRLFFLYFLSIVSCLLHRLRRFRVGAPGRAMNSDHDTRLFSFSGFAFLYVRLKRIPALQA